MGACSAPNRSNEFGKKRMLRFPRSPDRRKRWAVNCRRDKWAPTENSRLYEDRFEPSQYESNRSDEWEKLRPDAVPTLFNVPNPPKLLESRRNSTKRSHSESPNKETISSKVAKTNEAYITTIATIEPVVDAADVDNAELENYVQCPVQIQTIQCENEICLKEKSENSMLKAV